SCALVSRLMTTSAGYLNVLRPLAIRAFGAGLMTVVMLAGFLTFLFSGTAQAQARSCVPAASSLVGWWPLEIDGTNLVGTVPIELTGTPPFVPGAVGQGLEIAGAQHRARLHASAELDLGAGPGLTIEFWVRPGLPGSAAPLVEWNDGQTLGLHLWL